MMGHVFLALAFSCGVMHAEIIDRIAVSVGTLVITESEVRDEIRVAAFLNGDDLDFGHESRRRTTERLIEQKLLRKEMELGSYPAPAEEEAAPVLKQVRSQRLKSPAEYTAALEKYGISEQDLKTHLLWQIRLLQFVDFRFRGPADVAALKSNTGTDGGSKAESDKAMDEWLKQARERTRIEYHQEAGR